MHLKSPTVPFNPPTLRFDKSHRTRTAKLAMLLSATLILTTTVTSTVTCEAKPSAAKKTKLPANANWYPASIALPAGLKYPCNLTPLPHTMYMYGIPTKDRLYINHVYAMILRCAQAKTIMVSKLTRSTARSGYAAYYATTVDALKTIREEPTPRGLEIFRNEVMQGIILQMKFFQKAVTAAEAGSDFNNILKIPEGKQASTQLQAAWTQMKTRYTGLNPDTENSMYHHLCALDLF